jgi:nucleotide-binding universal stress UspA family protein
VSGTRRPEDPIEMRRVEVPEFAVQDAAAVSSSQTALLVLDMQNDFVHEGGSLVVPEAEPTIPAIKGLLELARAHEMRIVYSQDTHREGDPEWQIWPEHCREGSFGWEIVRELAPAADDTVLRKVRYDAFYGTPLDYLLRGLGCRHARDMRHSGQHLRALHRRKCRAALLRRGHPSRRSLGARAVRPGVIPAPDGVCVRRADYNRRRCTGTSGEW